MKDIELDVLDFITVYSLCEKTLKMQAVEYTVYDMSGDGFYLVAADHTHTYFLPIDTAFHTWVLKDWELPFVIDTIPYKKNGKLYVNLFGESKVIIKDALENLGAGQFDTLLKSVMLYTIKDTAHVLKPLYPDLHHNKLLEYKEISDTNTIGSYN